MGVYPLFAEETRDFVAVELDGGAWPQEAAALRETCRRLGLSAVLERSRSGKGGHLWLFFDEAISARVARNPGCVLLSETMEGRPQIGRSSYERLFPNQATAAVAPLRTDFSSASQISKAVRPSWAVTISGARRCRAH